MIHVLTPFRDIRYLSRLVALLACIVISACSSDVIDSNSLINDVADTDSISSDVADTDSIIDPAPTVDFEIRSSQPSLVLLEGDPEGLRIPLSLTRNNGHDRAVELTLQGSSAEDVEFITSSFSRLTLVPSEDESEAILKLSISAIPIQQQQREFIIIANDGIQEDIMPLSVSVQPTLAPDVYLLVGQSNMIGFSGDGTRESFAGGLDEPDPRILQLNVSRNNSSSAFQSVVDYTSTTANLIAPEFVTALDPLHVPRISSETDGKENEAYIGLGLSFAKQALQDTSADIILVPAAWSGSSFCQQESGPEGNWMPQASLNPALGNTLLFDRAVTRANLAIERSGGILRGILWHQGESDSTEVCAALYADNLQQLAEQLRTSIIPTGSPDLQRVEREVPFVVGTMSRGVDEREDLSFFNSAKQQIDDVHRNVPNLISTAAVSNHDDLVPANGYPCGNTSCIHFGPDALREMGRRYYEALRGAVTQ